MVKGDLVIFSANRSFLLRKRIIDVSVNHLLLQIESNSFILSIMRFYKTTSKSTQTQNLSTSFKIIKFNHRDYVNWQVWRSKTLAVN